MMITLSHFDLYPLTPHAIPIEPAPPRRTWMDQTSRHIYRCTPVAVANGHGWIMRTPHPLVLRWNGASKTEDLAIEPQPWLFAKSHFADGIVTLHPEWLIRTPPGWNIIATGPFNDAIDGLAPLSGVIETDWLPATFTMNWRFTRPGTVMIEAGTPFLQMIPIPHAYLADTTPLIRSLDQNPNLAADHEAFIKSRQSFYQRMEKRDPEALKHPWERHYHAGRNIGQSGHVEHHINRLRLKHPKIATTEALADVHPTAPPITPKSFDDGSLPTGNSLADLSPEQFDPRIERRLAALPTSRADTPENHAQLTHALRDAVHDIINETILAAHSRYPSIDPTLILDAPLSAAIYAIVAALMNAGASIDPDARMEILNRCDQLALYYAGAVNPSPGT